MGTIIEARDHAIRTEHEMNFDAHLSSRQNIEGCGRNQLLMDGSVFEKRHVYILQEAQKRTRDLQTVGGRDVYVAPATAHKQLHFKKNRHQNTVTVHAILEKKLHKLSNVSIPNPISGQDTLHQSSQKSTPRCAIRTCVHNHGHTLCFMIC